jgi:hypothetical protein
MKNSSLEQHVSYKSSTLTNSYLHLEVFIFVKIFEHLLTQGHPGCSGGGEGERDGQLYGEGQLLPPSPLRHVCRGERTRLFFFSRTAWVPSLILRLLLPVVALGITVQCTRSQRWSQETIKY